MILRYIFCKKILELSIFLSAIANFRFFLLLNYHKKTKHERIRDLFRVQIVLSFFNYFAERNSIMICLNSKRISHDTFSR